MARNGSGVYSLPAGSTVANGDTSDASDLNTPLQDIEADMNTPRPIVAGGTGASSAGAALTALGAQPLDAGLTSISGLTTAANKMLYTTASDVYAVADLTAAGRAILDDADAAAQRATLGLVIGTNVQAQGATLTSLEGLSLAAGDLLYATAADTLARLPKGTANQVLAMNSGATAPEWGGKGYTWLTPATTTSGTAFDFTGIPSWATEIAVAFAQVSLSGSDSAIVQIGDSGGFETTGYDGASVLSESGAISTGVSDTSGFHIPLANNANAAVGFVYLMRPFGDNEWMSNVNMSRGAQYMWSAQRKTLSDTLTQVRVTRSGTNTFDLGRVNVGYR